MVKVYSKNQLCGPIYVASRASIKYRPHMWKQKRAAGWPIIWTWIDEAGAGETEDFEELWKRIENEIYACEKLVFYAEAEDFPFKGALIEIGICGTVKVRQELEDQGLMSYWMSSAYIWIKIKSEKQPRPLYGKERKEA